MLNSVLIGIGTALIVAGSISYLRHRRLRRITKGFGPAGTVKRYISVSPELAAKIAELQEDASVPGDR